MPFVVKSSLFILIVNKFCQKLTFMRDVTPEVVETDDKRHSEYLKSIVSLFPQVLANVYEDLDPKYLEQSEVTIRTLLKPTEQMEALRSRLWTLIKERTNIPDPPRIQLSEMAHGIAPLKYVESALQMPLMAAWCGIPTMDYETRIEAMLDRAYFKLKEILELPLLDDRGKLDMKAASLIIQVAKMVDLRSRGNYTERIESKTLQVNASASEAQKMFGKDPSLTLEQIEDKIAQLEGGKRELKDVEAT